MWKTHGFLRKIFKKWWVFHIYISLQEGKQCRLRCNEIYNQQYDVGVWNWGKPAVAIYYGISWWTSRWTGTGVNPPVVAMRMELGYSTFIQIPCQFAGSEWITDAKFIGVLLLLRRFNIRTAEASIANFHSYIYVKGGALRAPWFFRFKCRYLVDIVFLKNQSSS